MKLLRYGPKGSERPAVLDSNGVIRDLSGVVRDIAGAVLTDDIISRLHSLDTGSLPEVKGEPRLAPCVGSVGKFMCIGLNYSDHAAEAGMAEPSEPILFTNAASHGERSGGW